MNGKLVYAKYTGAYNLFESSVDGADEVQVTPSGTGSNRDPAWSPDGTQIAFTSDRDGLRQVYVMKAAATSTA